MFPIASGQMTLQQLQALLDPVYALAGHNHSGVYAPASHVHAIADVSGLQTALDGKASTSHTHAIANVTGLQTALDGKAADSAVVKLTGAQTVAGNKNFTATVGNYVGIGMMNGANDAVHSQYGFYNNNNGMMRFGFVGADLSLNNSTCIEMWAVAGNYGKLTGDWRSDSLMVGVAYLCGSSAGVGDVRLQCTKSGNGADQALYLMANRYAEVGTPPRIEMAGKEVYIGAYTDGSTSHSFADVTHGYEIVVRKQKPLCRYGSGASDPTTTDVPAGFTLNWLNTTNGELRTWANVAGTMRKSAAFT
jgi:hypothetical protein